MIKNLRGLYAQWDQPIADFIPGYTLLLPLPGDLPVFLKIALEVCMTQDPDYLVETLVIPDKIIPGFRELLEVLAKNYSISPIRLVKLKTHDLLITHTYNHYPFINHWLQLVRGVEAARTTHALLHDADLFITEPSFLKTHYKTCVERRLACLGVSPVNWDSWYGEQGINHLTATWEMIFDLGWLRSFKPLEHVGHECVVDGKRHKFDTTLWPQSQTPPEWVGRRKKDSDFIHFSYVISTYRFFQQSQGPYEDECFRLLLIRLLINVYDQSGWSYDIPSLNDLIKGITDSSNRVTYIKRETKEQYLVFRLKLKRLIESHLLNDEQASILEEGVRPFDQRFGYR